MNTLYPSLVDSDLPLHVHRQEEPAQRTNVGLTLFRSLCSIGFFILFSFSIVVVALVMLTKGLTSRKKIDVSLDTQDKQQDAVYKIEA